MLEATVLCILALLSPQDAQPPVPTPVHGTILDDRLQPLAGVKVAVVLGEDGDPEVALQAPLATTGADGSYRCTVEIPARGTACVVFGGTRWATAQYRIRAGTEDEVDLGAYAMAPGFTTAARIRDASGAPLADALVVVTDLLDEQPFVDGRQYGRTIRCRTLARTDAKGIARLRGMVRSMGRMRVSAAGNLDRVLDGVGIGVPLDVTMEPSPRVSGRVLGPGGAPIAGARVSCGGTVLATTDADGAYAVSIATRGPVRLYARPPADSGIQGASAAVPDGGGVLDITLAAVVKEDVPELRIRAVDAAGAKVEDFRVLVSWNATNQLQYRCDAQMLVQVGLNAKMWMATTTDGEAVLRVPKGTNDDNEDAGFVFVIAKGHGLGRIQIERSAIGGDPIAVKLDAPITVRGRIVDAKGLPIAGIEVIPTQRLEDNTRRWFQEGHWTVQQLAGGPTSAITDADGRYELSSLLPGSTDLFLHSTRLHTPPPIRLDLTAGASKEGVDFTVPNNVDLHGRMRTPLPPATTLRAHWHRPNMSSSSWATEFDGAVSPTPEGTFALLDLMPKEWLVEAVLATPPRGGGRFKLPIGSFAGDQADGKEVTFDPPKWAPLTGKVGGPVPWQRLGVAVQWQRVANQFNGNFHVSAPYALVEPDRSFRLATPRQRVHVVLFDLRTGVALEWQELDATTDPPELTLAGEAFAVALALPPATPFAQGLACDVEHVPEQEDWPSGVGDIAPKQFALASRNGMKAPFRAGDELTYYVRNRSGRLVVQHGEAVLHDVDLTTSDTFSLPIGKPR